VNESVVTQASNKTNETTDEILQDPFMGTATLSETITDLRQFLFLKLLWSSLSCFLVSLH